MKMDSTTANELRELKSLLDDGILTQEEFDIQKAKILENISQIEKTDKPIQEIQDKIDPDLKNIASKKDNKKEAKENKPSFFKAKTVGEYFQAKHNPELASEINNRTPSEVLKNMAVAQPQAKQKDSKLIKAGVMCPKCHSQDILQTGFRQSIISLAGKQRGYMTCKNCGNSWRTK